MPDPFTLGAIGAVALTEGIKFLYNQTGEAIKRWRDRRSKANEGAEHSVKTESVEVELPAIFEGQLVKPEIHFEAVERLEPELKAVRQELSSYVDETDQADPNDEALLTKLDALRIMLEAIYQQRISFRGEERPASGTTVEAGIDVEKVVGYVAGVRARSIKGGNVRATVKAKEVSQGGTVVGVDIADTVE